MRTFLETLCRKRKVICTISVVLTTVITVIGYKQGIFTNQEKMQSLLTKFSILAPILFMGIQAIQVVIPILPGAIGCVFGVFF